MLSSRVGALSPLKIHVPIIPRGWGWGLQLTCAYAEKFHLEKYRGILCI